MRRRMVVGDKWDPMVEWRVLVQTEAPGLVVVPTTELLDAAHRLMDTLASHAGVVVVEPREWCVWVSVTASGPERAIGVASDLVTRTAQAAGLPAWPIVLLEAARADVLDREVSAATSRHPSVAPPRSR